MGHDWDWNWDCWKLLVRPLLPWFTGWPTDSTCGWLYGALFCGRLGADWICLTCSICAAADWITSILSAKYCGIGAGPVFCCRGCFLGCWAGLRVGLPRPGALETGGFIGGLRAAGLVVAGSFCGLLAGSLWTRDAWFLSATTLRCGPEDKGD